MEHPSWSRESILRRSLAPAIVGIVADVLVPIVVVSLQLNRAFAAALQLTRRWFAIRKLLTKRKLVRLWETTALEL